MDYTTVFEIRNIAPAQEYPVQAYLILGATALILGLVAFVFRVRRRERRSNLNYVLVPVVVGTMFLAATPAMWSASDQNDALAEQYRLGKFDTAEGVVNVLRKQPEHGHAPGDLIEIDSKQFEINHFRDTIGYAATLSNGGHLGQGVAARISYIGGDIVRVEIRKPLVE